jgi:hypothetical protein
VCYREGTPALQARVFARGVDALSPGWSEADVGKDGAFSVYLDEPGAIRLRAGLPPSGVRDMAASEVRLDPQSDRKTVVLTVPSGRSLLVRIPDWPAFVPGAARLTNGPHSPGASEWIVGGVAKFESIDARAPLSVYCGPLPDGRIAFSREIPVSATEIRLPLVASRRIRGRARGFPAGARFDGAWADTRAFTATGRMGPDGRFLIRGVPPGICRVCAVFKRGAKTWAGSTLDAGDQGPVDVEVRRMDEAEFAAWVSSRPP